MDNLPQLSGQYECVYTGYGTELQTSSERFSEDELTCVIPPKENISQFTSISGRFICLFTCRQANETCTKSTILQRRY